jgi:putative NADH-flavin reductase
LNKQTKEAMKKVIVFGATGGTGRHVIQQALDKGYRVTAVARNPEQLLLRHPNLNLIKGDVLLPDTFQNEMIGHDAVISCLGIAKIQQTTLYSSGMQNIIKAMQSSGIKRIICVSSGAISIPPNSSWIMTFLIKNVLQRLYRPLYSDMLRMENALAESDLYWTILRAPKLTNGKKLNNYRIITRQPLRNIPKISRADLADYIINHLFEGKTYKSSVEIAY